MKEEQLSRLLERAEEIQAQNSAPIESSEEVEQLVKAAQEAGLQRDSVMQALRERMALDGKPLGKGQFVYVKSTDGIYYPGKVDSIEGSLTTVKLDSGSKVTAESKDIICFMGLPGDRITCWLPLFGWRECPITSYKPKSTIVYVTNPLGKEVWVGLDDTRMNPSSLSMPGRSRFWLYSAGLALSSGAVGAALTWLLMR